MKNFKRIISEIGAMVICGCSMTFPMITMANDGLDCTTEGIIDEAPAEVNIPIGSIYPRGTAGYEVFRAMTYAIHYTGDVSLWTEEQVDYWNTYWGDFYSSLLFIYQNSTSQKMFDESFFNLIGYPINNTEWTQGQKEEYASLYQVMFLELRTKLPNIMPEVVTIVENVEPTEIETITEPIIIMTTISETEVYTTSTTTITTEYTTTAQIETTETTTTIPTYIATTTDTDTTSKLNETTTKITSTFATNVANINTTVTTTFSEVNKIPETGDKGIFKAIIGVIAGVAALCIGSFVIGKRK